jgi:DNA modification methylase
MEDVDEISWRRFINKVTCGDCLELMQEIPDQSIDLVLTDPPYGVDYSSKNRFLNTIDNGNRIERDIVGDNLTKKDTQIMWGKAFKEIGRTLKPGGVIYCFMPQGGDQMMMMMMMNEGGIEPRHELIWLKNNHVFGRTDYAYIHEPILYAWKPGAGHKYYGGFQRSVLKYNKPLKSDMHPTTKPLKLVMRLIKNSSLEGDLVCDPFLGSGTTALACKQLGRDFIGFEISEEYCEIARKRLKQEQIRRWIE